MSEILEGNLRFKFPDAWEATKYDDWPYYRNQVQSSCCGNKAVDILALDSRSNRPDTLWIIEIKDFRLTKRTKMEPLCDEVAIKVRDTLAGLFVAKMNGNHPDHSFAVRSLQAGKLRVVLHLEQPSKPSRLHPREFDTANLQSKLKQLLKPVDAHPIVTEKNLMLTVNWVVFDL